MKHFENGLADEFFGGVTELGDTGGVYGHHSPVGIQYEKHQRAIIEEAPESCFAFPQLFLSLLAVSDVLGDVENFG